MAGYEEFKRIAIKEIREQVKDVYPKLRSYLEENRPELIKLYEVYYQEALHNENIEIASEYAVRIFKAYLSIKGLRA
jgi:glucose-6-phosphate isomerase